MQADEDLFIPRNSHYFQVVFIRLEDRCHIGNCQVGYGLAAAYFDSTWIRFSDAREQRVGRSCAGSFETVVSVNITGNSCMENTSWQGATGILRAVGAGTSCTLTFSKPLLKSSFQINFYEVNGPERNRIEVDGAPYAAMPSEVTSPSVDYPNFTGTISAIGGVIVNADPGRLVGNADFKFAPGGSNSLTSLTLIHETAGHSTVYRVCADDGGSPAVIPLVPLPPNTVSAIPALSDLGLVVCSLDISLLGLSLMRPRNFS